MPNTAFQFVIERYKIGYHEASTNTCLRDTSENAEKYLKELRFWTIVKRMFADTALETAKRIWPYKVLIECNSTQLWFANVFLQFYCDQNMVRPKRHKFACERYSKVTPPLHNVDEISQGTFLPQTAVEDSGYAFRDSRSDSDKLETGECYGFVPLSSMECVHHRVWWIHFVPSASEKIAYRAICFYPNRFFPLWDV